MSSDKTLKNKIEKELNSPEMFNELTLNILKSINCGIIITNTAGDVVFLNDQAKRLLKTEPKNIYECGYLFNFDVCILDKERSILTYSPFSVLLESDLRTTVKTEFQADGGRTKSISIISTPIENAGYIIILSENPEDELSHSYLELSQKNKELKDKIKENEQLRSQAQSQAIRESLANRISNAIRNSLEIETILQTSVVELGKTLSCDKALLIKYSPKENELPITNEFKASEQEQTKEEMILVDSDFHLQQVIETHEAATGQQIDHSEGTKKVYNKLIVPVIHHDELFRLIILYRQNRTWHSEEINLVQSVADQISVSIKNAQLYEDTTSKNIKISVLNEILKSINASLILDDVFNTIAREIKRLIDFDRGSIAILDNKTKQVSLFAKIKDTGNIEILRTGPLITKGSALGWAIENIKPIKIDLTKDQDFSDTTILRKSGIRSAIIIPMVHKGNVTGLFYIGSKKENIYGDPEVDIMTQIAGQIAIAVENAKLYWQTQTQALKETLINQIISSIRKSLKLNDVLQAIVNEIGLALGVSNCLFKYKIEDYNAKSLYEFVSPNGQTITKGFKEIYKHAVRHDISNKKEPIIWNVSNASLEKEIKDTLTENGLKTVLMLPLRQYDPISNKDQKIGLLIVAHSSSDREWSLEDINLLKILSDQVTVTINQSRLFEQTQKQKTKLEQTLQKLKEAQTQLIQSEKMAALGQLVAGVAHEINTPIGSIASNNSVYNKCSNKLENIFNDKDFNKNKAHQILNIIKETNKINDIAIERINDIVKSLKNFSRLDESELKKVDIHEGIESTLTLLRHELRSGIEVIKDFSKLPDVECYPNLLNQVFMNILVNARQSIDKTGTITINTYQEEDLIKVAISDTGEGINKNDLKKIFDPGFTTKGVGVGTGLGLSICYQIVEKHKGQIIAESEKGKGSTFTIIIPIKRLNNNG